MTGSLLSVRIPDDLKARLEGLQAAIALRAGGVPQDFSKVVRHVLISGLDHMERTMGTAPSEEEGPDAE